jgi:diguanylate cyclase (GGDEF)-like protein
VILPETGATGAMKVAENIRASIANLSDLKCRITVSVGVTVAVQGSNHSAEELVQQADQAMYAAKHKGRNRVCIFEGDNLE